MQVPRPVQFFPLRRVRVYQDLRARVLAVCCTGRVLSGPGNFHATLPESLSADVSDSIARGPRTFPVPRRKSANVSMIILQAGDQGSTAGNFRSLPMHSRVGSNIFIRWFNASIRVNRAVVTVLTQRSGGSRAQIRISTVGERKDEPADVFCILISATSDSNRGVDRTTS